MSTQPELPEETELLDDPYSSGNEVCDSIGHDQEIDYDEDDSYVWHCLRCGAEGWSD